VLSINPLYKVVQMGGTIVLQLQFPSPEYEEEFGACKRYLPERVEIDADLLNDLSTTPSNCELERLIKSRILLDLPEGYR
jgi:hypothetical protein